MTERKDLLALAYYKKAVFTGSDSGLRYRIALEKEKDAEGNVSSQYLRVWAWPEPFAFSKTPDEQKVQADFPFSEEGLGQIAAWISARPNVSEKP